jgi:hypothetical protein
MSEPRLNVNLKPLPQSPMSGPQPVAVPDAPPAQEPEVDAGQGSAEIVTAFVPKSKKTTDPLVQFGCKMPLSLRTLLEEITAEYNSDMTSIVVEILQRELPKIPRRKKR